MPKKTIVGRVYNEPKRSVNREEVVSKRKVGMTNNVLKHPAGNAKISKSIVGIINNELPGRPMMYNHKNHKSLAESTMRRRMFLLNK
jgi:hypothetical protein